MATIKIHNAETGEIIERDMTPAELKQAEADNKAALLHAQAIADKEAAKQAVLAKLGLTADEVAALLG
jgi:phosphopantetheinyl transferase (holo-ACP synthase)